MLSVPNTTVILPSKGICKEVGKESLKDMKAIKIRPKQAAMIASKFSAFLTKKPSKKIPNIPPAKIPESFHQTSNRLYTPIILMPKTIPKLPMQAVAKSKT